MYNTLSPLVGKKIVKVRMNEDYLVFETDSGPVAFTVYGDCCSRSYFYDFYGVEKLIKNGPVKSVDEVDLGEADPKTISQHDECISVYGYRITTENDYYGEQSSVFSFRNSSNGYYGGSLESCDKYPDDVPEITKDTLISQY